MLNITIYNMNWQHADVLTTDDYKESNKEDVESLVATLSFRRFWIRLICYYVIDKEILWYYAEYAIHIEWETLLLSEKVRGIERW
jgi:hypothetical protein